MRLFLALVALVACALLAWVARDDFLVQRPALAAARTSNAGWAAAQDASARASNAFQAHCEAAEAAAVRSGAAITRAARVAPAPKPGEEQPMVGNDTLRDIVGQGR